MKRLEYSHWFVLYRATNWLIERLKYTFLSICDQCFRYQQTMYDQKKKLVDGNWTNIIFIIMGLLVFGWFRKLSTFYFFFYFATMYFFFYLTEKQKWHYRSRYRILCTFILFVKNKINNNLYFVNSDKYTVVS